MSLCPAVAFSDEELCRFAYDEQELVRLATHGGFAHAERVIVFRVVEHVGFADDLEAGFLDLLARDRSRDTMQVAVVGAFIAFVVDDDGNAARFQRVVDV